MKTVNIRALGFSGVLFSLTGCMGGGTATDMMVASTGMKNRLQAAQPPSAADMALTCPEIQTRLGNLHARCEEVDRQQRARAQQSAMIDGVLGVGTLLVGGQLLGAAGGSVQGMQAAAAAAGYGWFNNRRLLEPTGNIPPAEAEATYHAALTAPWRRKLKPNSLRETRRGSAGMNAAIMGVLGTSRNQNMSVPDSKSRSVFL